MIDCKADLKFWQSFLKCVGLYTADIDCDFGPKNRRGAHDFVQTYTKIANQLQSFDDRSEGNIQALLRATRRSFRVPMSDQAYSLPKWPLPGFDYATPRSE